MIDMPQSIADDPVDGSPAAPDLLDRNKFAAIVASALQPLRSQSSSSVVALVGQWGAGKTSLIKLVERKLKVRESNDDVEWIVVEFNPWQFQDLPSLQVGFLGALQGALDGGARTRRKEVRQAIGRIGERLAPLGSLGAALGWNLSAPVKTISSLIAGRENPAKDQTRLEELLAKDQSPVLIVLDDLDRLGPDELLLVFKLIRLVGRFPYVHYLIAYDEDTLLDVLSRTGLVGKKDTRRASDYLEKMIQLRLDLPPLRDSQIETLVETAVNEMAGSIGLQIDERDTGRFASAYQAHVGRRLNTPRAIKRYVAQVESLYASLGTEVDAVDFLLMTWLRTAEPLLYGRLYREKVDLTGAGNLYQAFRANRSKPKDRRIYWEGVFRSAKVSPADLDGLCEVLGELFPRFGAIWSSQDSYGGGDHKQKRVANRDYFDRYFVFDVPDDDIPDSSAELAYSAIIHENETEHTVALASALRNNTQLAIHKMESIFEMRGKVREARPLLLWLARQLPSVPDKNDLLTPYRQVVGLCSRLYLQLKPTKNTLTRTLEELVALPQGLALGARLVNAASEHSFGGSAENVEKSTRAYPEARAWFAGAIKTAFDDVATLPVFDIPDEVWGLMWIWRDISQRDARLWIDERVANSVWTRLDVAARLVSSRSPMGVANPTWKLSELDMKMVDDIVGIDDLIAEIGATELRARQPLTVYELKATPVNRRAFVLEKLRDRLLSEDESA